MGVAFWLSYAGVTIFILLVLFAIDLWVIMMILNWIGRIIKEGRRDIERVFRFFCDCGRVWEAKEHEVIVTLDVCDKNKVNAVCGCPYCGRVQKGVEI